MGLSDHEERIVRAIGQALFPRDGVVDRDGMDADLAGWTVQYVAALPPDQQLSVKALIRAVDVGYGALSLSARKRFVDASPDEQRDFLDSFEQHSSYVRRMAFEGLRTLLMMGWLGSDSVKERLGLDFSEPWAPQHYGQGPAPEGQDGPALGAIEVDAPPDEKTTKAHADVQENA